MRKHFLILMLLSLLPLAGWAQTASFGDMSLGKYTYGGTTLPVPLVRDSESTILTEGTHYTVVDGAFTDEACTKPVDADYSKLKADGTKYYRKIEGKTGTAYETMSKTAYFTVEKASLVLQYSGSLDRVYGADPVALDASKFSVKSGLQWSQTWDGVKKGDAPTSYTTADNNAGTGKAVTFVGGWTADNYTISYDVKLNITAKALTASDVTITAYQGDVVYTGNTITPVYTIKYGDITLVAGNKKDYTVTTAKDVNTYTPTVTFANNYSGNFVVDKSFKVTKAPITVIVGDVEQTYNGNNQADQKANAEISYSGIVGGDIATAADIKKLFTAPTSVTAGWAVDAGTYTLNASGATAGTAGNYEVTTYVAGTLTINQAEITITASDREKELGKSDPGLGYGVTGKHDYNRYGTTYPTTLSGIALSRAAGEDVGEYDITPDVSNAKVTYVYNKTTYDITKNYTFKAVKGTFTIKQGAIVVTIKDAEKFYGQEDPEFTYAVTGLQAGDELAAFTITRDAGEAVKGYALNATVANPNPTKYKSITVVPAIFTIKKAQLEFTIPAQNVKIGDDATALNKSLIKVEGINNSDKDADLYDLSINGSTAADAVIANGIQATLRNTKLITENKTDYKVTDLYEIVTDKTTDPWTVDTKTYGKLIVGTGGGAGIAFTTATDDADYNLIKTRAGETADVTLTLNNRVTREVPAGTAHPWAAETWNTMVLPFEVTVAELSAQLGYAIVNRVDVSKTTENNVQFKLEMQKVPANEPFCVKTSAAIANGKVLTFTAKKIVDGGQYPSVDAGNGYKFVGAYQNLTIDKNHPTYNFLRGDNVKWAHIGASSANSWTVVPFDAYVDLTAAAAPEMVTFTFQEIDGSITAIKNVEASVNDGSAVKTGWYTIDGKKLNAAPAQKGIYIYNGKKFVVK